MKKLLITLGALTLASTSFALAEFTPTGSLKQEIRWYGDAEEEDQEGIRFTLAEGGIKFTDKFYIDYRVRKYLEYKSDEDFDDNTEARTRLYYEHGYLGNTKISVRERFEAVLDEDANRFTYSPEFRFRDYIPKNDVFRADVLTLRPSFRYQDDASSGDGDPQGTYKHAGLDFLSVFTLTNLPERWDFQVEFNIYNRFYQENDVYTNYSIGEQAGDKEDESGFAVDVEFYTYLTYDLFEWQGINFALYHEFGIDPYTWNDKIHNSVDDNGIVDDEYREDWVVYNDLELQMNYKVNTSTSIYGALAVEHANHEGKDRAGDYKWQPYAYVGWKTIF